MHIAIDFTDLMLDYNSVLYIEHKRISFKSKKYSLVYKTILRFGLMEKQFHILRNDITSCDKNATAKQLYLILKNS